ncbi:unnamed protein product [Rotaria sp. Silwood2]|nr:unnamed protein product [Rotaria sp. Silwood2]
MDNMVVDEDNSPATTTNFISTESTSFGYEDLIIHIQAIQSQMIKITKFLDDQWKNEKNVRQELKSRSITFIDPYGNKITNEYMDHELISTLFKKYTKDYVPKCLQKWIQIEKMNQNGISSLSDDYMKLSISKYPDDYQFNYIW